MKKYFKYIFLFCLIMFSFTFIYVRADSGWDTDYDSGWDSSWDSGYDSGWDSDWDSSWDSSWDSDWDNDSYSGGSYSSYSSSGNYDSFETIFAIFMVCIIIYLIYILTKKPSNTTYIKEHHVSVKPISQYDKYKNIIPFDELTIKKSIPTFNKKQFLDDSFNNFVKLQNAWMNFNYTEMKPLISDELFSNYKSQLKVLGLKKQKNIMRDFELHSSEIVDFTYENGIGVIKVVMLVSFFDYVVDVNNKVVRGDNRYRVKNKYELIYIMKERKNISGVCPGCGAKLENSQTSVCSYCRMKITNNNHDWVLSKKQVISRF